MSAQGRARRVEDLYMESDQQRQAGEQHILPFDSSSDHTAAKHAATAEPLARC